MFLNFGSCLKFSDWTSRLTKVHLTIVCKQPQNKENKIYELNYNTEMSICQAENVKGEKIHFVDK